MTEFLPLCCPYCGEGVELDVDDTGGSRQSFVQDCPVCCQPWQVELIRDRDGDWSATLRTVDE
jgi:Cysteine-rich CPXCG